MFGPLLLLILASATSLFAADISGKWVGSMSAGTTIHLPGHDSTRLFLTLHQSGGAIEGDIGFFDKMMISAIRNPALNGNVLAFETYFAGLPVNFRLAVAHGKMIGEANYQGQRARVTLTGPVATFPVVVHRVKAAYSDEGRRAKYEGTVMLVVQVDETGRAASVKVVRSVGLGLDEMAVEAVKKWRFRPATDHGRPVPMETTVEIPFRLR